MIIQNKKVTVIGLGKSGVAVAQLLAKDGCQVKVTEIRDQPSVRAQAEELTEMGIAVELGRHQESFYADAEVIVPCPGVKPDSAPIHWAKRNRIPILSEMEVACRKTSSPIIGITGTNGKTTVTTLVGEVLKSAGKTVKVGGNIGTPLSVFVEEVAFDQWIVLEISSFQLEYTEQFRPKVAVILNITPDHLDHHKDMEEYFSMKARITERQTSDDFLLLNAKDLRLSPLAEKSSARSYFFNDGRDNQYPNDNLKAAALTGKILGIPEQIIQKTFSRFKGVEHRLEEVGIRNGVRFINDSKSTNVDSLRWALENVPAPIHLIAGGRDKGGNFSELNPLIREKAKKIVLIGESAEKLKKIWAGLGIPIKTADSLKSAILFAYQETLSGAAVLLSPGCASFDMFSNYEDRGRQFKQFIHELSTEDI